MKLRKIILGMMLLVSLSSLISCKKEANDNNPNTNDTTDGNESTGGNENTGGNETTGRNENTGGNESTGGNETTDGNENTGGNVSTSNPSWDNVNSSSTITILEAQGHLESAYIEWTGVTDAVSYNVYYKEESATEFTKIDDMLVRLYPTYLRADAVGLKAGSYTLKIAPVFASGEGTDVATANVTVAAHDRSGFAFSQASTLKDASGAYNTDGTLKNGAQVIYVTKDNAKTVTATVNGTLQKGFQTIIDAKQKKNTSNDILCFRIIGTVSKSDLDHISSSSEGLQIKGADANTNMNVTIEGIGEDATFNGFGMLIRNSGNVEVRNIGIINFMDDGISVDTGNCNLWLHNVDFFYGNAGGDADQAKGDGSLDIKKSHYITVSYNHFWDAGKCCLLDASVGTASNYITYHHNWFDHSDSRHPRVRNASAVHVYNNFYDGVSKYGIGAAGGGSSVFSEANYFRNTKYPLLTSKQGSDIATDSTGTFSGEDGGVIKSFGDVMIGGTFVPYSSTNSVEYDAYVASSKDEVVPNTVVSKQGAHTYSNFDTAASMYSYNAQSAEDAKTTVEKYAGRINNGDLQYDFNDSTEDINYEIVSELKSMVVNYKTTLVKVLGTTSSGSSGDSGSTDTGNTGGSTDSGNTDSSNGSTVIDGAIIHNFTESGKISNVFSITGNMKDSPNPVTYNGVTYTEALKMESESKTNISFTTTQAMTLVLVTDSVTGKKMKIDGTKYDGTNGIFTLDLEAGAHTILKGDSMNLFAIILTPKN